MLQNVLDLDPAGYGRVSLTLSGGQARRAAPRTLACATYAVVFDEATSGREGALAGAASCS